MTVTRAACSPFLCQKPILPRSSRIYIPPLVWKEKNWSKMEFFAVGRRFSLGERGRRIPASPSSFLAAPRGSLTTFLFVRRPVGTLLCHFPLPYFRHHLHHGGFGIIRNWGKCCTHQIFGRSERTHVAKFLSWAPSRNGNVDWLPLGTAGQRLVRVKGGWRRIQFSPDSKSGSISRKAVTQ